MAFGDGGNDIPMLRHVGTGVAMGKADGAVKAEADYVTTGLNIYDVIELGESKFLYIPFCGEHFKWE